jgi:23S rRNA pseudouridine1911/1915/1917 synthase
MASLISLLSGMTLIIPMNDDEAGNTRHTLTVTDADAGLRLDRFLTSALSDVEEPPSRSRIKVLFEEGRVSTGESEGSDAGRTISEPAYRVKPGESFCVHLPAPKPATPMAEDIPLDVIYEDAQLIVINKPAGLVVHPAPGSPDGTLVNALLAHCGQDFTGIGGEMRPGIVHRLDKETSGVMVVAKTEHALKALQKQFAAHGRDDKLERAYTAFVWGKPHPTRGTVDAPLARSRHNRLKITVTRTPEAQGARNAITHYRVASSFGSPEPLVSELICHLETGRTHQIRVHMTHIGHPILGDPTYGTGQKNRAVKLSDAAREALTQMGRQALHAHLLGFEHPETGEKLRFESPLAPEMAALRKTLEEI